MAVTFASYMAKYRHTGQLATEGQIYCELKHSGGWTKQQLLGKGLSSQWQGAFSSKSPQEFDFYLPSVL